MGWDICIGSVEGLSKENVFFRNKLCGGLGSGVTGKSSCLTSDGIVESSSSGIILCSTEEQIGSRI